MKKTSFRKLVALTIFTALVDLAWVTGWNPLTSRGCHSPRMPRDFNSIGAALRMYEANCGRFPSTTQGLDALVHRPAIFPVPDDWIKLLAEIPRDPWQNPYRYEYLGGAEKFRIISAGPDGAFWTEDDIASDDPDR